MTKNENETIKNNINKELEHILTCVAKSENVKNYNILFNNNNQTKGEGFSSELFTGEVLNEDDGKKLQVAIKRASTGGFSNDIMNEKIFKNEIYFYSKLFFALNTFQRAKNVRNPFQQIPKFFTGNVNSTSSTFLAMENLKTQGYILVDKKKFLDSEHIELVFKTYGKFHALSFCFKQKHKKTFEDLMKNFTDTIKEMSESDEIELINPAAYFSALKTFDPVIEADSLSKLQTVENVLETFKNAMMYKGVHKCLIHGDCWTNNMMFKYKQSGSLEDMKLVDFQAPRYTTPIHDLSDFFYSAASKRDMDKLDYYLDVYYQSFSDFTKELGENPEDIFPLEVLKKEWKQYGVYGILLGCQIWLMKLIDEDDIESVIDKKNEKDQTSKDYNNLWEEKWTKVLEQSDFKECVKNICLHAVEYGIIG